MNYSNTSEQTRVVNQSERKRKVLNQFESMVASAPTHDEIEIRLGWYEIGILVEMRRIYPKPRNIFQWIFAEKQWLVNNSPNIVVRRDGPSYIH